VFSFTVVIAKHLPHPIALISSISMHPLPALMKTLPDLEHIPYDMTRGLMPSRFVFSFAVVVARHPPPPIVLIPSISTHPPPALTKTSPDLKYIPYNMTRGLTSSCFIFSFAVVVARHPPPPIALIHYTYIDTSAACAYENLARSRLYTLQHDERAHALSFHILLLCRCCLTSAPSHCINSFYINTSAAENLSRS
jgi:hypothetical protein